jgi:uncharacterized lipoprotein YddW (UPF0748 family)
VKQISYIILLSCLASAAVGQVISPKHEFRGVWIASVANIDWPSKPGLSAEEQQKEFLKIISMHKENGMNALLVQVRPCADAFYPSRYEPWSSWLTGELGKAPEPYYDPLKFMIDETHKSGLEFHAWFNPYRAVFNADTANIHPASIASQHREWFVKYDKHMYFNPGLPEARKHVVNVIMDVVNRYDVDGIHFDDYFYPYKVAKLNFPDSATYQTYGSAFSTIDDWRRNNVDQLIKNISDSLRQVKRHVKFGVSPFGVWRNKDKDPAGSDTKAGQTCYDDLYADVLKWMKEGWIDYVTPQIYWSIGFTVANYDVIAKWWNENNHGIPVYIGQAAYRVNSNNPDTRWKEGTQIPSQIRLNRSLSNIQGSVFFSSKSFIPNPLGICDSLKSTYYKYPALPSSVTDEAVQKNYELSFITSEESITLQWNESGKVNALSPHARYVIYRFEEGQQINLNDARNILTVITDTNPYAYNTQRFKDTTALSKKKYLYVVTGLNRRLTENKPTLAYPVKNYKKYWRVYPPVVI